MSSTSTLPGIDLRSSYFSQPQLSTQQYHSLHQSDCLTEYICIFFHFPSSQQGSVKLTPYCINSKAIIPNNSKFILVSSFHVLLSISILQERTKQYSGRLSICDEVFSLILAYYLAFFHFSFVFTHYIATRFISGAS